MAKAIKDEFKKWVDSDVETALIDFKSVDEKNHQIKLIIGDDSFEWSITYPSDYPKSKDKLFVFTEEASMQDWMEKLNNSQDKKRQNLSDLLTAAAELYLTLSPDDDEGGDSDNGGYGSDDMFPDDEPAKPKEKKQYEQPVDMSQYLNIGSAAATLRLVKDLRNINPTNTRALGFTAQPIKDKATGLDNLYQWEVRLFDFDKKSELYHDIEKFKKQKGQDYIQLEMRFSKDYPFLPPFVRVVSPRFAFRTGHVTVGGSICMELLTNSGWRSTNDIESILIQIRAEMMEGGARLDPAGGYEYSEHEAWDAFYRAAKTHNWDTNGLSPNMFPNK